MTYPIFNLYPQWEEELIQEFVRYDDEYHSNDKDFFETYFLGQTFVDSEGNLYQLVSAEDYSVTNFWIFKSYRKKLHFKPLNERLSFEEFKSQLQKRASTLNIDQVKQDFHELLKSAHSIEELLNKM